ncbi:MAG: hypothetical protein O7F71_14370 [Gammaproteobacteria bacterium]|nr:hypothetical protein [Gammaproteobacteria bacterium]
MSDETNSSQLTRDLILRFESECDPFKYRVRECCLWPVFRFAASQHIKINLGGLTTLQSSLRNRGPFARVGALYAMFEERLRLQALKLRRSTFDVVSVTHPNRLRYKVGRSYRNVYLDFTEPPIENALQIFILSRAGRKPAHSPSLFFSPRTVWPKVVMASKRRGMGTDEVMALHADLSAFLADADHTDAMLLPVAFWRLELANFLALTDSFIDIFRATRPKVVIMECYYDKMWAIAAARQLNIPVLELQHGIIYDGHMAYTYDPGSASRHREWMTLPDRILTFGRYFSEIITSRGFWTPAQIEEVGFPRMEYHQADFEYRAPGADEKLRVLISSQWIMTEKLISFLQEAVPRLPDNVVVNIKAHPSEQDTSAYRRIEGVGVLDAADDFYELMLNHHIHCSVFSTTLLESIGLGVPTMIIGLPGSDNALPMTEKGYCKVANSPDEFAALLGEAACDAAVLADWVANTKRNISYFWEPGASANIHAAIAEAASRRNAETSSSGTPTALRKHP